MRKSLNMHKFPTQWTLVCLLMIGVSGVVSANTGNLSPETSAQIKIDGSNTQPSNLPLIFDLTVENTGRQPLVYACCGPADYPGADLFWAQITNQQEKVIKVYCRPFISGYVTSQRTMEIVNGQVQDGPGAYRQILPGRTLKVPIAMSPLPSGQYDFSFR